MGLILVVNSGKYTVHEWYGLQKHTATFDAKATKFQLRAPNNANVVWDIVLGTFMFSQKGTRSHILLFQKLTKHGKGENHPFLKRIFHFLFAPKKPPFWQATSYHRASFDRRVDFLTQQKRNFLAGYGLCNL